MRIERHKLEFAAAKRRRESDAHETKVENQTAKRRKGTSRANLIANFVIELAQSGQTPSDEPGSAAVETLPRTGVTI